MWADVVTVNGKAVMVTEAIFGAVPCWYLRAAAQGALIAAAAQAGPGTCQVVDNQGHRWDSGQVAFGVNCVGIAVDPSGWIVTWMQGPEGATYAQVVLDTTLRPIGDIKEFTSPYGHTSQGFLDVFPPAVPIMTDQNRTKVCGPMTVGLPTTRGSWTAGQSWSGQQGVVAWNAADNTAWMVSTLPNQVPSHLTIDGQGQPWVVVGGTATMIGRSAFTPWKPSAEPPLMVPTFPPLPPVNLRVFGEPGYENDVFPARHGMPALVFCDLGWDDAKKRGRYDLARQMGAELAVYVDDADFDPDRVPFVPGVKVIPLQQAYPKRHAPALTGRLESLTEREQQIDASLRGLTARFPRVGMALVYYCQIYGDLTRFNWPPQHVLDLQRVTVTLAKRYGVTDLALFHASRADGKDGIASRPAFQQSERNLRAVIGALPPPDPTTEQPPTPEPSMRPTILQGDVLTPERHGADPITFSRVSGNRRFRLRLQGDLNFVLDDLQENKTLWDTGIAADRIECQPGTGNLIATNDGQWAWHSGVFGPDVFYNLGDDGRLAAIKGGKVVTYADKKWEQELGPEPAPEPEPDPGKLVRATGADLTYVLANFCNLRDAAGRVVYTPALSAAWQAGLFDEWMTIQRNAGSTHVIFGPLEAGDVYPGIPFGNPDMLHDLGKLRQFLELILSTKAADGKAMRPVLFLDGGGPNPRPRINDWPRIIESIRDYLPYMIIVPGWELIKASHWTSADMSVGLQQLGALKVPHLWVHLSVGRASFASNPIEADDPWQGGESACWKSQGGEFATGFFAQLDPLRDGENPNCDPADDGCYLNRWEDIVPRIGNGMNGWRVMPMCLMEYAAYYYYRGQASDGLARDMATAAKRVADKHGVTVGYGNGLPWGM